MFDKIIVVTRNETEKIRSVIIRDGCKEDVVKEKMALQFDYSLPPDKKNYPSYDKIIFLENNGSKNQLKSKANEAASILGLTLTFKSGTVEVYKNGKLIETLGVNNSGKLVYTGNNTNAILVVSSIVAVALTAGFVARKKFANA